MPLPIRGSSRTSTKGCAGRCDAKPSCFFESIVARQPQRARLSDRQRHVRQRTSREALRHPECLRRQFQARGAAGRDAARAARSCQHPDRDLVRAPDVARPARQMDHGQRAGDAAAAAAAQRADADRKNGQTGKTLTMREAMGQHRANPTCASCHARMDPLGFAFENFDAIGRWRTQSADAPIDASGVLPDGTKFDGAAGLLDAIMKRPEQFAATLTERLLTYAVGRGVEYYDAPAVRAITREAAGGGYRFASIVAGVVKSVPFQMRTRSGAAAQSREEIDADPRVGRSAVQHRVEERRSDVSSPRCRCPGAPFCEEWVPRSRCRCSTRWCRRCRPSPPPARTRRAVLDSSTCPTASSRISGCPRRPAPASNCRRRSPRSRPCATSCSC